MPDHEQRSESPGARPDEGRAPGRVAAPATVALQMEDLAVWLAERVAKFARAHKFTVGDRIVMQAIEVCALLAEAAFTRDKVALVRDASKALFRLQASARLAERLHLLSERQYAYFATQSAEVGRQIIGWQRHSQRKASAVSA